MSKYVVEILTTGLSGHPAIIECNDGACFELVAPGTEYTRKVYDDYTDAAKGFNDLIAVGLAGEAKYEGPNGENGVRCYALGLFRYHPDGATCLGFFAEAFLSKETITSFLNEQNPA